MNRPHGGRMVGFSDHVDLGGVGLLRDDPQIALRLSITDLPEPPPERIALHLRGTAFDAYDGRAWSRTTPTQRTVVGAMKQVIPFERWPDATKDRLVTVELEPFDPPVLFVPPDAVAVEVIARTDSSFLRPPTGLRVERGPEGEFRYRNSEERGVRYQMWLSRTPLVHAAPLRATSSPRYLALPPLPRRIADLAHEWTQGASTPMEKARAIETKLRTEYRYDLASPSGGTAQPLDDFLFVSRRGHCEFYSTAMAVLLRYTGVPTRNVTGFVGGSYNRFSRNYIVRQGDAHSWVEACIDGIGWTTFDPTPPADAAPQSELRGFLALVRDIIEASSKRWDRDVVGYDIHQQISLLERFRGLVRNVPMSTPFGAVPRRGLIAVVSLALLAGAIIVVQRRFRRRDPSVARRRLSARAGRAARHGAVRDARRCDGGAGRRPRAGHPAASSRDRSGRAVAPARVRDHGAHLHLHRRSLRRRRAGRGRTARLRAAREGAARLPRQGVSVPLAVAGTHGAAHDDVRQSWRGIAPARPQRGAAWRHGRARRA